MATTTTRSRRSKTSRARPRAGSRMSTSAGRSRSGARSTRRATKRAGGRRAAAQPASGRSKHTSRTTTDHDEIRRWAEARGGQPAEVKRTSRDGEVGIIRIDFPGFSGARSLEKISWDDFFEKFEDSKLALVYQDKTAGGRRSNFNKLVKRD